MAASSYTDSGLTDGATYYYVVAAPPQSANDSDPSNEASGTFKAPSQVVMRVANINVSIRKKGSLYDAKAVVTTVDGSGSPVADATVEGKWSLPGALRWKLQRRPTVKVSHGLGAKVDMIS